MLAGCVLLSARDDDGIIKFAMNDAHQGPHALAEYKKCIDEWGVH